MVKVLNFCNYNLARFGGEAYKQYLNDPRVIVDQPPQCMTYCWECQYSLIAIFGEIRDQEDQSLDVWELLQRKSPEDLVKIIEEKLKE